MIAELLTRRKNSVCRRGAFNKFVFRSKMSEADTIEVLRLVFLKNTDKIGIDNGYKFETTISALRIKLWR